MEQASEALVERRYFDCERLSLSALVKAHADGDFGRMARILLPLQEARRQKRDLAFDAGAVSLVSDSLPSGRSLRPGCYLVEPPRVGVDGRMLREAADKKKVPAIVVVREPRTKTGLWPIVAIGPCTIRTQVQPPTASVPKGRSKKAASAPAEGRLEPVPTPEWFLHANEALGDAALAQLSTNGAAADRVEALMTRLQAHPDHEKIHQALHDACVEAAREPRVVQA